jgi:STE24 endopeptidase
MTDAQRAEAKEYGRRELQCSLADMALDLVYLAVMAFGAAILLDRWLLTWPPLANDWLRLSALYAITMLIHYGLSFPLSFYAGFLLEHKYKLSRQSLGRWLWRYLLQNVLATLFGLVLVVGLYAIIWWTGPWWWVVAALGTFVVTVLLGQFVPVLILPLFYKIERLQDEELAARLDRLAEGTSLNLEGVYRMKLSSDTVKANALLAGLGHTRRVILGDTLLDEFTAEEIEVVFAHEIGHHVYHHISKLILIGLVYSAVAYLVCDWAFYFWVNLREGTFDYARLPVYTMPLVLFIITLFSLVLSPLRNMLSRRFETACDRYALRTTGNPEAYRSAFSKLARLNKADPDPHPWEVVLMHDHPPIKARLALADEISAAAGDDHSVPHE